MKLKLLEPKIDMAIHLKSQTTRDHLYILHLCVEFCCMELQAVVGEDRIELLPFLEPLEGIEEIFCYA